jgi:hypothetical protein
MTKKKLLLTYLGGMKLGAICKEYPNVPERTITLFAKNKRDGIKAKRPGPQPILSVEIDDDLKAQIVGMQCQGSPVSRDGIRIKGNELVHSTWEHFQVGSLS